MNVAAFQGSVAIDTNVFLHLLNPAENSNQHIDRLLHGLMMLRAKLLVDDGNRITGEYNHQIGQRIRNSDETGNAIYVLRYWLNSTQHLEVEINGGGPAYAMHKKCNCGAIRSSRQDFRLRRV